MSAEENIGFSTTAMRETAYPGGIFNIPKKTPSPQHVATKMKPSSSSSSVPAPRATSSSQEGTLKEKVKVTAPKAAGAKAKSKSKAKAKPKPKARKAAPKRKKKRDPNKPKAARSGYIYFCGAVREEIFAANPHFKQQDLLREFGKRWKASTPDDRKPFDAMARADKIRHAEEMKNYVPPPEEPEPKKMKASAGAESPSATKPVKKKRAPMSAKRRQKLLQTKLRNAKQRKHKQIIKMRKFVRTFHVNMRKRKREREVMVRKHETAMASFESAALARYPIEDVELAKEPPLETPLPPLPQPVGRIAWPSEYSPDPSLFRTEDHLYGVFFSFFPISPVNTLELFLDGAFPYKSHDSSVDHPPRHVPAASRISSTCGTTCAHSHHR
jgi:hypothetical protein